MRIPSSAWAEVADHENFDCQPFFPFEITDPDILRTFSRFCALAELEPFSLAAQELFIAFLGMLLDHHRAPLEKRERRSHCKRKLGHVRDFIEDNYDKILSLDDLADLANLSKYHFLREFSSAAGMPPHAFQLRVRLNRAKAMLSEGLSIKQVAAATGFSDVSHFGRNFVRIIGFTPRMYQKSTTYRPKQFAIG